MGGQVWKPKIDQQQIEEQKQEKEKSDRAWRTSNILAASQVVVETSGALTSLRCQNHLFGDDMGDEEKPKLGWGGPRPGSGRPRGRIDPRPKEIREMLLQACALSDYGRDPAYPDEPGSALQFFRHSRKQQLRHLRAAFVEDHTASGESTG